MNAKTIAAYSAVLAAIAGVFIALETWVAQTDIGTQVVIHWLKALAAGVVPVGTAGGVLYFALVQLRVTYVNAGLNLAASGNMVDKEGKPIQTLGSAGATPPKPATAASAPQIVKDYGDVAAGGH